MSKIPWLLIGQVTWLLVFCSTLQYKLSKKVPERPVTPPIAQVQPLRLALPPMPQPPPAPPQPSDPELIDVQVPIPKEIRQFNNSGSQCVWCTIAMLCRYHNVEAGKNITDQFRHATGPGEVDRVLTQKGIKFKQVRGRDENFIEEYVTRKKLGVGIGVNGNHVILVCHFDKTKGVVKVIDNSDRSLRIQTWDMQKFRQRFSGWVFVIYPPGHPDAPRWGSEQPTGENDAEWRAWWNSRNYR